MRKLVPSHFRQSVVADPLHIKQERSQGAQLLVAGFPNFLTPQSETHKTPDYVAPAPSI